MIQVLKAILIPRQSSLQNQESIRLGPVDIDKPEYKVLSSLIEANGWDQWHEQSSMTRSRGCNIRRWTATKWLFVGWKILPHRIGISEYHACKLATMKGYLRLGTLGK